MTRMAIGRSNPKYYTFNGIDRGAAVVFIPQRVYSITLLVKYVKEMRKAQAIRV